jgi:DNA repair exonuclease SbcCD ATPase subunit
MMFVVPPLNTESKIRASASLDSQLDPSVSLKRAQSETSGRGRLETTALSAEADTKVSGSVSRAPNPSPKYDRILSKIFKSHRNRSSFQVPTEESGLSQASTSGTRSKGVPPGLKPQTSVSSGSTSKQSEEDNKPRTSLQVLLSISARTSQNAASKMKVITTKSSLQNAVGSSSASTSVALADPEKRVKEFLQRYDVKKEPGSDWLTTLLAWVPRNLNRVQSELRDAKSQVGQLEVEISRLCKNLKALHEEQTKSEQEQKRCDKSLSRTKRTLDRYEKENQALVRHIGKAEEKLKAAQAELIQLKAPETKSQHNTVDGAGHVETPREQLQKAKKDAKQLRSENRQLTAKNKELERGLLSLQQEYAKFKSATQDRDLELLKAREDETARMARETTAIEEGRLNRHVNAVIAMQNRKIAHMNEVTEERIASETRELQRTIHTLKEQLDLRRQGGGSARTRQAGI